MQGAAGAISMHRVFVALVCMQPAIGVLNLQPFAINALVCWSTHRITSHRVRIFNAVSSPDGYTLGLPLMESGGH